MSGKKVWLGALVLSMLGVGAVWGQGTPGMYGGSATPTGPGSIGPTNVWERSGIAPPWEGVGKSATPGSVPPPDPSPPVGLSSWILGRQHCDDTCGPVQCCGPVGGNGPIGYEIYLRGGPSFVVSGNPFSDTLKTGWGIQMGARTLFFNVPGDAAWTVDFSISNVRHHAQRPDLQFPLEGILVPFAAPAFSGLATVARYNAIPGQSAPVLAAVITDAIPGTNAFDPLDDIPVINGPGVTIRSLNRTFVNLALGREWWLTGTPSCDCAWCWRVGFDAGGRYGSGQVELGEFRHRTDVMGGPFCSFHSDVEIPCGCCVFYGGMRLEYDYIFSDILQHMNDADVQNLNLLFSAGVRF